MSRNLLILLTLSLSTAFARSPVPPDAKLEKVATKFSFVEGPVWKDGALLFSDISAGKIYRWDPLTNAVSHFMDPSYESNGLSVDGDGNLVFCQMGYRRVVRMDSNKNATSLASDYNGKHFNSPNDLVLRADGSVFFTDPDYNVPGGIQNKELTFCGIFSVNHEGNLHLLDSTLQEPNGICFSPDGKKLYVNDSGKRIIYMWDFIDDSTISGKREFARMATTYGNADGMKCDSAGNIFCTGPLGVWVFSPSGAVLDTILVPETASNCNWGDPDGKTLYITARTSVYRIRFSTATGIGRTGTNVGRFFRLFPNFPNPFNPATEITYTISSACHVTLKIYDTLGRELETLVNASQRPGSYRVTFDGSRFPSGLFFCSISGVGVNGERFVSVDKMVMVK